MQLDDLISLAQPWITWLEEKGELTLEELFEEVEFYCRAPIICGPTNTLDAVTTGISIKKGARYYIAYDEKLPELLVDQTILHELIHILKGDADAKNIRADADKNEGVALRINVNPASQKISCDFQIYFDRDNEELVEYLADCYAEKLIVKNPIFLNSTMKDWFRR